MLSAILLLQPAGRVITTHSDTGGGLDVTVRVEVGLISVLVKKE